MLHIVCILGPYLTYGTWHNGATSPITQGLVRPCKSLHNLHVNSLPQQGIRSLHKRQALLVHESSEASNFFGSAFPPAVGPRVFA